MSDKREIRREILRHLSIQEQPIVGVLVHE